MEYSIIWLIIAVVFGAVSKAITSNRGMKGGFWWGFFLGIIGVIVVAVRPKDKADKSEEN